MSKNLFADLDFLLNFAYNIMSTNNRPSYKTVDFWATLVGIITGILYLLGIIGPEGRSTLDGNVPGLLDSGLAVLGVVGLIVRKLVNAKKASKRKKVNKNESKREVSGDNGKVS